MKYNIIIVHENLVQHPLIVVIDQKNIDNYLACKLFLLVYIEIVFLYIHEDKALQGIVAHTCLSKQEKNMLTKNIEILHN